MRPITQEERELYKDLATTLFRLKVISAYVYATMFISASLRSDIIIT